MICYMLYPPIKHPCAIKLHMDVQTERVFITTRPPPHNKDGSLFSYHSLSQKQGGHFLTSTCFILYFPFITATQ